MTRKLVSPEIATGAVLQKNIFLNIWQSLQENTWPESLFKRSYRPEPAALLKKRLWHRCFPVNLQKILRTLFLQNTSSGWFCPFYVNGSGLPPTGFECGNAVAGISVWMRENKDQKNSKYGRFSRSVTFSFHLVVMKEINRS